MESKVHILVDDISQLMYAGAVEHCEIASQFDTMATAEIRLGHAALSVVSALISLEAYINTYARDRIPEFCQSVDGLRLEAKWVLVPQLVSGRTFDRGTQPFQDLTQVIKLRNYIVHHRPQTYQWDEAMEHRPGPPSSERLSVKNAEMACGVVPRMIRQLHELEGTKWPHWVDSRDRPDWLLGYRAIEFKW
jgi:hypothetical protein